MNRWDDLVRDAPETADRVRTSFDAGRHKFLASIRRDGSPRLSGIECQFIDGDLWVGSMPGSHKAADLRRDPRLALHSPSPDPAPDDPTDWVGDAKIRGLAIEVTDDVDRQRYLEGLRELHPEMVPDEGDDDAPFDLFRVELTDAVTTRIGDPADHLVIEVWRPGGGVQVIKRH